MKRKGRRSNRPLLLIALGSILIVLALVAIRWTPGDDPGPAATPSNQANVPYPEIKRVSLSDAKAALDLKTAVFLDVRGEEYYRQGHVPGAVSIPFDQIEARMDELDKNAWIIPYCT